VKTGGANKQAMQKAIEAVEQGNVLCLFPEGAANPPIPLHKILPGAAMIAQQTGAPIIPFRVSGVWPFDHVNLWRAFYRRSRARIVMGEPLDMAKSEGRQGIRDDTQMIRHGIRSLSRFDQSCEKD